ncbi:MAG: FAD-dependent oxidoreductase [Clostridia bacterium]|nr:FAD-dependent oxidoreductase [Clostridia bacterium]
MKKREMRWLSLALAAVMLMGCLPVFASGIYAPGEYTASAVGRNGAIQVKTTLSDSQILAVEITEQAETPQIATAALEQIPAQIVAGQTLAIDAIAGATMTCDAIIAAVADCIDQAGGDAQSLMAKEEPEQIAQADEAVETSYEPDVVEDYDIIVVGGGLAGMTAATEAVQLGANVLLLEKLSYLGGQGLAGEGFFAHNTDLVLEVTDGQGYDKMEMLRDVMEFGSYMNDATLWNDYIDASTENYEWIKSLGIGVPEVEGQKNSYIVHHNFQGHDNGGTVAINAMEAIVKQAGGTIMMQTPATDLCLDENGEIKGVYAKGADGTVYQFNAPAVILCTGGFLQSEEWMEYFHLSYDRRDINSTPGHDGDGLRMAYGVGAATGHVCIMMLGPGLWGFSRDQDQIEYALTKTGALWVNQDGVRFCNEDIVTTNYTLAANAVMSQHEVWAIFDDAYISARATSGLKESLNDRKAGGGLGKLYENINKGLEDEYLNVVKADTIEELAQLMDVPTDVLKDTIEKNNQMYEAGADTMFGKDPFYLYPVDQGPYYALYLVSNSYCTMGGLQVDKGNRVRSTDYTAIPHLYAAGTEISGLDGTTYGLVIPGSAMGYCIYSGRNSAQNAVSDWLS